MKVTHSPKCSQLHNTITASKRLVACPGLWWLYIMSWIPNKTLKSTEYTTKRRIIGRKFLFLHTVSHKLHILKFPQHVCPTYLLRAFPSWSLWSLQFFSPFYATLWPRDSPRSVAWRPVCQYKSSGASPLPPQWKWKQNLKQISWCKSPLL